MAGGERKYVDFGASLTVLCHGERLNSNSLLIRCGHLPPAQLQSGPLRQGTEDGGSMC